MANDENLIPFDKRSVSEVRECGRKGGKASGKSRREKKTLQQCAQMLMSLDVGKSQQNVKAMMQSMGVSDEDMTNGMAMICSMFVKALQGDVHAARFMRDTLDDVNNKRFAVSTEEKSGSSLADTIESAYKKRLKEQKENGSKDD